MEKERPVGRGLAALSAAGLALLLRLPFLGWPMVSDEGGYAYTARWWLDGFTLYGPELWFDRPQGIFLAYAPALAVQGGATWVVRLWGGLWAAATAAVVVALVGSLAKASEGQRGPGFGAATALSAGVLTALLLAQPAIEGFTANAELFALLPATGSVWALLRRRWGVAGLLAGAAFMLKPSAGSVVLVGGAWLLGERAPVRAWLAYGVAAAALPLAGLLHGALTVGVGGYLYAVAGFRLGVEDPLGLPLAKALSDTMAVWLPSLALSAVALATAGRRVRLFLGAWLLSAAAGMALGGNWFWHYFVQAVPPLAVGAALGCRVLWGRGGAVARAGPVAAFLIPLVLLAPWVGRAPEEGAFELYGRPGYRLADDVATALRARTAPDETVYVAFAEAQVYHLAGRRSAVPHLYWLELLRMPGAYEGLLEAVAAREPARIFVMTRTPETLDPADRFLARVREGYVVDTVIGGRPLYRRR